MKKFCGEHKNFFANFDEYYANLMNNLWTFRVLLIEIRNKIYKSNKKNVEGGLRNFEKIEGKFLETTNQLWGR